MSEQASRFFNRKSVALIATYESEFLRKLILLSLAFSSTAWTSAGRAENLPTQGEAASPNIQLSTGIAGLRTLIEPSEAIQLSSNQGREVATATVLNTNGPAHITVSRGETYPTVESGASQPMAIIGLELSMQEAQVKYGRHTEIVGRPLDIFRPRGNSSSMHFAFPTSLPVTSGFVSSRFGPRLHPIAGGYRMHSGVDFAAPYGTPIRATTNGVVGVAGWRGGYGLSVSIINGGVETRYGHMSRVNVSQGQRIRQGEVIGYVGSTGRSTGPHVHYEVRTNGQAVDPLSSGKRRTRVR